MPQMAPSSWIMIMLFTLLFLMMTTSWVFFFNKKKEMLKFQLTKKTKKMVW
uniref:ATP synthase F0 subunit 8 n=1 Tax=Allocarsidara bakeri TaxID=2218082 RepID=A0A344A230_9HEMI|nr:ATP synthase F0 subunit 8 [Allocarsidara bakeri]AWU48821.1 ATP synthase F0 subunit 8 [Allocarsidara bakeri]